MSEPTTPVVFPSPVSTLKDQAIALLVMAGSDADEVEATLFIKGCFGTPVDCGTCPVAVYLMRELDLHAVSVLGPEVALHYGPGEADVEYIETTDAVDAFVEKFDDEEYPRLIAGRVTA
jgi:hypothetical protein